ncbi:helix-turn-helix transcriptional regulator [Lysobacter sp. CA196]|uniref:helix-turn-helix transcriptional regulator n=1 Tax=Lysobacter sp. CA196 TaxID=3455606 RepID=UPI003F8D0969
MPGPCACKDQDSKFLYANTEFKALVGLEPDEDVDGLSDFDLPCEVASHGKTFREQDKYVMERQISITTLNVHRFKCAKWRAFLIVKKPFFDQETNIRGVLFHGTDITAINAGALGSYFGNPGPHQASINSQPQTGQVHADPEADIDMTRREYEVLFFLLRGGTSKRIAELLSISSRTVEQYIDVLKDKFEVLTKPDLIEKAINKGYLYVIPDTLFMKCSSKIIFQGTSPLSLMQPSNAPSYQPTN